MKKKIVIITDAWYPQVNGVVTTYTNLIQNIDHIYITAKTASNPQD